MQVQKQQLELDMEQWTGSKLGKEYFNAVYCHPAYLTSMQSTLCERPGWMNHKKESRLLGEMSITSNDITLMAENGEKLKSPLIKVKKESEKIGVNSTFRKLRSWHPVPSLHGKQMGKQWK